jgi:hypothetical protein
MIDDIRLLRNNNPFWSYLDYNEDSLINFIMSINEKYKIYYEDSKYSEKDILIAKVD